MGIFKKAVATIKADITTFEVGANKELHVIIDGVIHVYKEGATFFAHEIGLTEAFIKKHLGHAVKVGETVAVDVEKGAIQTAQDVKVDVQHVSVEVVDAVTGKTDGAPADTSAPVDKVESK